MVYFTVYLSNLLEGSLHSLSVIQVGTSDLYSNQHLGFFKNVNLP